MRQLTNQPGRAFIPAALAIAGGFCALSIAQDTGVELEAALEAIQSTPPTPASEWPANGTFFSVQHAFDWPPIPGNIHELPAWPLGDDLFLLDDADLDYEALAELMAAAGFPTGGVLLNFQSRSFTSNDLWLEIHGVTNGCTGWTADLTIHTPEGDTNSSYDLLYSPILDSPTDWQFLMRCPTNIIAQTNVYARYLCEEQGFFILSEVTTNCDLVVTTNVTPQQMVEMLVPPWVTVANVTYTGAVAARGVFSNGNCCGLPIEIGVILSSGDITNALGSNSVSNATTPFAKNGDSDLEGLIGDNPTLDAAVLEFDLISSNAFTLAFRYVFASEEYPEFIGAYNDPMGIFVSTNRVSTNWINTITNDFAMVPCATNVPVGVSAVNGGCPNDYYGSFVLATNVQYYLDNDDPGYSALPQYSMDDSVFNIQYDGKTVLLTAQTVVSAHVTNHVKIAVVDYAGSYGDDDIYDSAVFIEAWSADQCP